MAGWYELVEGEELQQGDLFSNCPIAQPPNLLLASDLGGKGTRWTQNTTIEVQTYDIVVLSQSCDLLEHKLSWVLVCPLWLLSDMENAEDEKIRNFIGQPKGKGKEEIRRGNLPGYHMLAGCDLEGFQRHIQIADFRSVFSIPFGFLSELATVRGKRLRLFSPYREHLSQAFARFVMRVGLPVDIPPFK